VRGTLLHLELAIDNLNLLIEMLKLGVYRLQCFDFLPKLIDLALKLSLRLYFRLRHNRVRSE
jgi:hypothetical protein